jgi:hypothetical protein
MNRIPFVSPRPRLNRRAFMRAGLGGLAGATVAAPLLGSLAARGQAETFPTRLLVFFTPNGTNPDVWFPTAGTSETDFTLNATHQALAPFRDKILFTSGINMESLQIGPGEPHQRGMGAVLTGTHLQEGNFVGGDGTLAGWGNGISLDQHVANTIGQSTPFKSLELGVRIHGSEVRHRINYAGPAQPLPPQVNPRLAWNSLFADLGTEPTEAAATKARRQRVLAAAREQFLALRPRLSSADLQKLDQHHSHVAEMEARLDAYGTLGEQCQQPSQPPLMLQPEHEDNMDEAIPLQIDNMVMALACDLTRVGTLQMSSGANNIRFPHLSSYSDDHQLSHAGPGDTTSQGEWATRKTWYAEQFAYLLGQLDAVPEGDGTLLDHTLILWCSELAQGNTHSHANMPFLLAGGQSVGLQTGRYVQYTGARHNDMLIAMMNAMGIDGNVFGDPAYCGGPLAGLFA